MRMNRYAKRLIRTCRNNLKALNKDKGLKIVLCGLFIMIYESMRFWIGSCHVPHSLWASPFSVYYILMHAVYLTSVFWCLNFANEYIHSLPKNYSLCQFLLKPRIYYNHYTQHLMKILAIQVCTYILSF